MGRCKQLPPASPPRDIKFQYNITQGFALEFGDNYMRVKSYGAYVTESSKTITGATQSNPAVLHIASHGYSAGDWIYISGITGMLNFNSLTWIVDTVPDANHVTLKDLFGNVVNSTIFNAYVSGGTSARIYTLSTPYAAIDLPYLKYTQSENTMTLTCVNQRTATEYKPYELVRISSANWALTPSTFSSTILAPTGIAIVTYGSTTATTWYSYVVTSIDKDSGEESVASSPAEAENCDISVNQGSNAITWTAVANAERYNVYKATPSYTANVPVGVSYGYAGYSLGTNFTDTNITADFSKTPPVHIDPFSRGTITDILVTGTGASYTQATIGYHITTSTGSGFAGTPVVISGGFVSFVIANGGEGYLPGDTITITDSGSGTGATAALVIGKQSGTYPGVPAYFQQRRAYANTINDTNTYWLSQTGLFDNFDASIPAIDSDAITGSPWSQQVNGIQFLVSMPNGLIVLTGNGAWLLNGTNGAALTPADQQAAAQAYNGCSDTVPPIVANYEILYVQSKGSIVRDLSFNFFTNVYTGSDITVLSNHLFQNYSIIQWAYAEEPYKLIWAIRDDGTMLSLTFLKEQDVYGWARHDTNGLFMGVCSITERHAADFSSETTSSPLTDAVYLIVKRYVNGAWYYYSERMDDRNWQNIEDAWCVDSGLSYPVSTPNAVLTPSGITGNITFTASVSVFTFDNIGDVIRCGGGIATITGFISGTVVTAKITQDITATLPNDPDFMPIPQESGSWTISTPTTEVVGLNHLIGKTVSILADGSVFANQTVSVLSDGRIGITLPHTCSSIVTGLGYTTQVQALYLDPAGQSTTVQGKRKIIDAVTVRVEGTRGISIGCNQPDASTQPSKANVAWTNMKPVKERNATVHASAAIPLFTGDIRELIDGEWDEKAQVAVQSSYPLPSNILAFVPEFVVGDSNG